MINRTLIFILMILMLASCASSKSGSVGVQPKEEEKQVEVTETDTSTLVNVNIPKEDTVQVKYFFPEDNVFNIALLLPFQLDSINTNYVQLTETEIPESSMLAVEFYEGVRMAVDSLRKAGLNIDLHVFDTKNSPAEVSGIIHSKSFDQMDLMVGPVYNSCLRIAAPYAKRRGIPLVSPLSPSTNITNSNEYYIMVNPAITTHFHTLCGYVAQVQDSANILLAYPGRSGEISNASHIKEQLKVWSSNDSSGINNIHELVAYFDEEEEQMDELDIEDYLRKDKLNLFIIPSFDGSFVQSTLRQIFAFREDYRFQVLGMPTWHKSESMRLDYLLNMNTHITQSHFVNFESDEYKRFRDRYYLSYRTEPSEYAVKGYDIFLFFGYMLQQYGLQFHEHLTGVEANSLHTTFRFSPLLANSTGDSVDFKVDYLENNFVHLLRYHDFQLVDLDK